MSWQPLVHAWPRSLNHLHLATDWWLLFTQPKLADLWILRWPEQTRVIMTLFD